jgi:hypothetical protein
MCVAKVTDLIARLSAANKQTGELLHQAFLQVVLSDHTRSSSLHKVKLLHESIASEAAETFLYISDESPTTFHRWSDLTTDLQQKILSCLLLMDPREEEINEFCDHLTFDEHVLPLMLAENRELASLAQEVYYSINEFTIHVNVWRRGRKSPKYPAPERGILHHIRRLCVELEPCSIRRRWNGKRTPSR